MNIFKNNQIKFLFVIALINFLVLSIFADVRTPQFIKHEHISQVTDTGKLTAVAKPTPDNSAGTATTSVALVASKKAEFAYRASRSGGSIIPIINICDAVLSNDKSLLILLESVETTPKKYLNRLVFFDTANKEIVNAFEFTNSDTKYAKAWLTPSDILLIQEFNPTLDKNILNFYPLKTKTFKTPEFSYSLNKPISDLLIGNDVIFVKLEDQSILAFDDNSYLSATQCRGEAGKLFFTPANTVVNLTSKGTETLRLGSTKKLHSVDFNNLQIPAPLDIAITLNSNLSEILLGSNQQIYKLANLNTIIDTNLTTANNIIAFNEKQNFLLTISAKKEQLVLNSINETKNIDYNKLRPQSKTLIDKLFFIGENNENIMILCESGELFMLQKIRKKYTKTLLFKF